MLVPAASASETNVLASLALDERPEHADPASRRRGRPADAPGGCEGDGHTQTRQVGAREGKVGRGREIEQPAWRGGRGGTRGGSAPPTSTCSITEWLRDESKAGLGEREPRAHPPGRRHVAPRPFSCARRVPEPEKRASRSSPTAEDDLLGQRDDRPAAAAAGVQHPAARAHPGALQRADDLGAAQVLEDARSGTRCGTVPPPLPLSPSRRCLARVIPARGARLRLGTKLHILAEKGRNSIVCAAPEVDSCAADRKGGARQATL